MSHSRTSTLTTPAAPGRTGLFSAENLGPYDAPCSEPECAYCAGPETD
ncbi:hypothetical protein [Arthrobacter sp. Marseille-P9274]|nr:hypothetical protein [Arthrobacter sp. Marseille-P9274]